MAIAPALAQTTYPKGISPQTGVIRDSVGNLYGTTLGGGTGCVPNGCGVVFKLDTAGHVRVLYNFTGAPDGAGPLGVVTADSEGNFYGTTLNGGTAKAGVVYKVDRAGQETVLYSFTGGTMIYPNGVIRDSAGNLYGTTIVGGTSGQGVVFKLDTAGQYTVLHTFTGRNDGGDGGGPRGVIRDSEGNLYGTTGGGGTGCAPYGCGVVFKLDTAGQYTVLYSFKGGADGGEPFAGVIRDSAGNLYGTTSEGGDLSACDGFGCGVVYKLDTSGQYAVLYAFTGGADGSLPEASVIRDSAGNLYGTTSAGGDTACYQGCGVVFEVTPAGHERVYEFTGAPDGATPLAGVIRDSAGNLYGTTDLGGSAGGYFGGGVVYKVDAAGHETVLYTFPGIL
jgi:uncharacterized repeat protein (TIGR03803 family)